MLDEWKMGAVMVMLNFKYLEPVKPLMSLYYGHSSKRSQIEGYRTHGSELYMQLETPRFHEQNLQ